MSTKRTASVYVKNNSGGNATIQMTHQYSDSKPETGVWQASPGQTVGPLIVHYETGIGTGRDWWRINMQVNDGSAPGNYSSSRSKECMLMAGDAGKDITNTVDTKNFGINLPSGGCGIDMVRVSKYSAITNVFVLMLENHSFDFLFGNSGITGVDSHTGKRTAINGLTGKESNSYTNPTGQKTTYQVQPKGRDPMLSDPGHEFADTVEQLCGQGITFDKTKPYPLINNSGFAANYAKPTLGPPPPTANIGDIMGACDTAKQLPVLDFMARQFWFCDNWHSSMPGPTWPNRFFAMGSSSEGVDFSPSSKQIIGWESPGGGFVYENKDNNGSLFHLLEKNNLKWRLYGDVDDQFSPRHGSPIGSIPIATALQGITLLDTHSFSGLAKDLQDDYPYQFTWIEPNYGDATTDFKNGSSQHPMDSLAAGEQLILATYNAIRNSPLWTTSLLIITYDEHGGYYDHVAPPAATPPGDSNRYTTTGFKFDRYGVRVPTVVVTPVWMGNKIDHALYDHSSIPKTVENLFGLPNLTNRDASANALFQPFSSKTKVQADYPEPPAPPKAREVPAEVFKTAEEITALDLQPLPKNGNINGFVMLALKAEFDLSDGSEEAKAEITARAQQIKTRGDARRYIREVVAKADVTRRLLQRK